MQASKFNKDVAMDKINKLMTDFNLGNPKSRDKIASMQTVRPIEEIVSVSSYNKPSMESIEISKSDIDITRGNDPLVLYQSKDFKSLANKGLLTKPIDNKGNTIIHRMAEKLDWSGLEQLRQYNPNALTYEVMNTQNINLQTPLHVVAETKSIQIDDTSVQDFINYLINELKVNPKIPDIYNQIIEPNEKVMMEEEEKIIGSDYPTNLEKLNDRVKKNIADMIGMTQGKKPVSIMEQKSNEKIVENLLNNYSGSAQKVDSLTGGSYFGKRRIQPNHTNNIDDLLANSKKNSFVANSKNRIMRDYDNMSRDIFRLNHDGGENDDIIHSRYNLHNSYLNRLRGGGGGNNNNNNETTEQNDKNIDFEDEETKLVYQQERVRNKRLIEGDNDRLRNKENNLRNQFDQLVGGKSKSSRQRAKNQSINNENNQSGMRHFIEEWHTEDLENLFKKDPRNKGRTRAVSYKNKNTRSNIPHDKFDDGEQSRVPSRSNIRYDIFDEEDKEEEDIISRRKTHDYPDMFTTSSDAMDRPRLPRDKETDDLYRSLIQKIMDNLDVDEQTARDYRTFLKVYLEKIKPELRGRENDPTKVKELDQIVSDKKKLKSTMDKINIEEIKEDIAERRREGEKRKEERMKQREQRETRPRGKQFNADSEDTDDTKTKGKKKTKSSATRGKKVVESGFLQSDEILFSSDY